MKRLLASIIALTALILTAQTASAEGIGYSVSPSLVQLKSYNSNHLQGNIRITNLHQQPLTLSYSFMPIKQSGSGDGNLLPAPVTNAYVNMFRHVQISINNKPINTIHLQGLQTQNIALSIDIPNQLKHQDYYFTILFTPTNSTSTKTSFSTIQPSLGTTILISHSQVTKPIIISSFSTKPFFDHGPVDFNLQVSNPDVTIDNIKGSISIYSLFGQNIASIPLDNASLLQGSMRTLTYRGHSIMWPEYWLLGAYTAKAEIASGNNDITTQTTHFIALPLFTMVIIAVFTALIAGIAVKTWRKS